MHICWGRFCSKDYEPFDASDVDRYVVGDDYTPTWKVTIVVAKGLLLLLRVHIMNC